MQEINGHIACEPSKKDGRLSFWLSMANANQVFCESEPNWWWRPRYIPKHDDTIILAGNWVTRCDIPSGHFFAFHEIFVREPAQLDRSLFLQTGSGVIGIDGELGAGQTLLANEIQGLAGGTVLHLNDFCSWPEMPYLSQYKASNLPERFREALGRPPIIIEGPELLDALEFLQTKADLLVFASREADDTIDGCWEYLQRREPWKIARLHTHLWPS